MKKSLLLFFTIAMLYACQQDHIIQDTSGNSDQEITIPEYASREKFYEYARMQQNAEPAERSQNEKEKGFVSLTSTFETIYAEYEALPEPDMQTWISNYNTFKAKHTDVALYFSNDPENALVELVMPDHIALCINARGQAKIDNKIVTFKAGDYLTNKETNKLKTNWHQWRHVQSIDGKRRMDGYMYQDLDWPIIYQIKVKGYKKSWGKWRSYKTKCYIEPTEHAHSYYPPTYYPTTWYAPGNPAVAEVKTFVRYFQKDKIGYKVWTRGVGENDAKILKK